MSDREIVHAIQGSEKWSVHSGAAVFSRYVRAIMLTDSTTGSTAITVVDSNGDTVSTGELGLHVLEPLIGIKEVTAVAAGVLEYRVYF